MEGWTLKVHFCTWTVMSFLISVFSHGVTVSRFDMKRCKENERMCVTNLADCGPRPPSSVQRVTVSRFDMKRCKENERMCVTNLADCGPRPPSSVQRVTVSRFDMKRCKENERMCVTNLADCGPRPPSSVQRVTVSRFDMKRCKENERMCVTNLADCGPRPPSSVQRMLNVSCCYQMSVDIFLTCEWSLDSDDTESDASLIFTRERKILSCPGIFNPSAVFNVTARIKNHMTEIWSQPQTLRLSQASKPSQPVLAVLGSTEDSLVFSWRRRINDSCRLCYRPNDTQIWIQAPDSVSVSENREQAYMIKNLLPFTVYRAAVACKEKSGIWSDWSSEVRGRTLDRAPSRPPEVCYRLENTGGSLELHLMLKDLESPEVGVRILGYEVDYKEGGLIQNVTEVMAVLAVTEGNCSVAIKAFNTAGYGPAAHLSFNTLQQETPPSVSLKWVSSSYPGKEELLVQWNTQTYGLPVSHFAVQWRSERTPSISHRSRVDGFARSAIIQDVDPDELYLISVFPIYRQQWGSPQSLLASLQQGALMEAVNLSVASVNKTSVTVTWMWKNKSEPVRVNSYEVMLKKDSNIQAQALWLDRQQHTFMNLMPNTEYSLILLADSVSRNTITVTTNFDEVPVVAAVTPLLLLALTVLIFCILSRTVYKLYFFPPMSSPRFSKTGQWLMDPSPQECGERSILNIKDFQVTDVLGENGLIIVNPNSQLSPDDDDGDSLLSISFFKLDSEYVSAQPKEDQLVSHQSSHHIRVFLSEESLGADAALLHETKGWLPQREEEKTQFDISEVSHQTDSAVTSHFPGFLAESRLVYHLTCEAAFLGKTEMLKEQCDCSFLICDSGYIANTCSGKKTAHEDRINNENTEGLSLQSPPPVTPCGCKVYYSTGSKTHDERKSN